MTASSLTELQRRIAQREQELQALRQELQTRQSAFAQLTSRKEELHNQLREIEAQIAALAETSTTTIEPSEPEAIVLSGSLAAANTAEQPRLGEWIVSVLRECGGPMTARQLSEEAQRRAFQTAGQDPIKAFESRLQKLKNKNIVRRASGHRGYVLAHFGNGAGTGKSKPRQTTPMRSSKEAAKQTKTAQRRQEAEWQAIDTRGPYFREGSEAPRRTTVLAYRCDGHPQEQPQAFDAASTDRTDSGHRLQQR